MADDVTQILSAIEQELLARLKQRFPGHTISSGFEHDLRNLDTWRFSALPHDTAQLKQLEQECRKDLAWAHYSTGHILNWTGHPDQALAHFQTAIAIAGAIVDNHPENLKACSHLQGILRGCPIKQLQDPLPQSRAKGC